MGFIAGSATKRFVAPQSLQLGPWLRTAEAEFPFLLPREFHGLIGLRAIARIETAKAQSTYMTGSGVVLKGAASGRSTRSLLRMSSHAGSGMAFACGAPSPAQGFVADWEQRLTFAESGSAELQTSQYRTADDKLVNKDLFSSVRTEIASVLENGIQLRLGGEQLETDGIIDVRPVPASGFLDQGHYPFEYDYLGPIPEAIGRPLRIGRDDLDALASGFDTISLECIRGDGDRLRVAPLAGGRLGDWGSVSLAAVGGEGEIRIVLPAGMPRVEAQRSVQAAFLHFRSLAFVFRIDRPSLTEALQRHVNEIVEPLLTPDRHTKWETRWSKDAAAPCVTLAPNMWMPVGVVVNTDTPHNYFNCMASANHWSVVSKRTYTNKKLKNNTPDGRIFTASRSGVLLNHESKYLPYVRYGRHAESREDISPGFGQSLAWFWEAKVRSRADSDERPVGALLIATGVSQSGGFLGYGEELLALLRAFASIVRAKDAGAEINVLYLAV